MSFHFLVIGACAFFLFFGVRFFLNGRKVSFGEGVGTPLVLAIVVQVFFLMVVSPFIPTHFEVSSCVPLKSFRDKSEHKVTFFFGSGTIQGHDSYVFYTPDGDGFVRRSVPVEQSRIIESKQSPQMCTFNRVYNKEWHKYFGLINGDKKYELRVPEGTIISTFRVE